MWSEEMRDLAIQVSPPDIVDSADRVTAEVKLLASHLLETAFALGIALERGDMETVSKCLACLQSHADTVTSADILLCAIDTYRRQENSLSAEIADWMGSQDRQGN